ncbi:amino acid ABC transporter permease [Plantibacter sp. VKM Ac-2885]|jgi:glutamate transport system permease protein|uniref:amino acid ABC transporter permease n=1 Tax=Plantibacter TaxID=190323 RepID=UPI001110A00D|nr:MULTISPECIES: amino acid ABC transporter permease [Plantibacter]MBD8468111.1 amino acid ABC transporter permease [Plantibacter sp. CFBP 8798]MBF4514685.1 amino acid ABC transporter permease [Plantibacter sp. VKM Ac-2885]MBF4566688.1 amino acid ABC transporter permease [Plantibacter sp. VKM Ac-2876]MDD9154505.1 amino acid ABC transporter permease [Plantibacter flavus]CAH0206668.1 Arginine transport system permease protein ArtQ [Plantibacter cousiniae]
MSSVLFDTPGPKAIVRYRWIGAATVLVVAGILAFVVFRFIETGQFTASKWKLFTFPRVWEQILQATGATLSAFAVAAVCSVVLGLVLAIGRLSDHKIISVPFTIFIEFFRAVPVLILMMLMYYGLPPLGFTFVTPFVAVAIALTLYNGAVFSEIFRAGIESLPKGQGEAAYAIGLRKSAVLRLILFPQAIRAMLPVIIAQLVVALKDTALGFLITYQELLYLAKQFGSQALYGSPIIPSIIVMGSIYIVLCLILSGVAKIVEVRTRRSPRTPKEQAVTEDTTTKILGIQAGNQSSGASI